jgi:predicted HTH transcriptional regulator
MKIEQLLNQEEGKCLEFKRNAESKTRILSTIIAFANTSGGKILIGVEDQTHHIVGVDKPTDVEEQLANIISDNITPQLAPNIEIVSWNDRSLVIVEVFPGATKPYYIKAKGENDSTYIRVGSTNRLADRFMIESLRRTRYLKTFDEELRSETDSDILDFGLASELFTHKGELTSEKLITLGVLTHDGHKIRPTNGGILLFSPHKESCFPDAWVQAGSFRGLVKTHIIDSQDIHVPLVQAVDASIEFIKKHLNVGIVISDQTSRHQEVWSIPYKAIREAVINAIVHADYSLAGAPIRIAMFDDRLEIENPGLLPFGLKNIKEGVSKIRNRVIARVFREAGFIERWGSGIQRILSECREAGLTEPAFDEIGTHFRVTFYKQQNMAPVLDATNRALCNALREYGQLSTKAIAQKIGLSDRQTRFRLIKLVEKGVVGEISSGTTDPNKKYMLRRDI